MQYAEVMMIKTYSLLERAVAIVKEEYDRKLDECLHGKLCDRPTVEEQVAEAIEEMEKL